MMARTWRDYSAADNCDNRDTSPPIVPFVATVTGLPAAVVAGLETLASQGVPLGGDADLWPLAVADALRLASDGWAKQALSLGWSELDLYGFVPNRSGDLHGDGLAAWLQGRKVLALSTDGAAVLKGETGRAYFLRPRAPGASLLWAAGHGR